MKARIIETGEIIEVAASSGIYRDAKGDCYRESELNFNLNPTDVPGSHVGNLKEQYAGMALQGLLSNPEFLIKVIEKGNNHDEVYEKIAHHARNFAEALVDEILI